MSARRPKKDKRLNNGRDYLIILIIQGVTKAGIKPDQKKAENKKHARKKVKVEDE